MKRFGFRKEIGGKENKQESGHSLQRDFSVPATRDTGIASQTEEKKSTRVSLSRLVENAGLKGDVSSSRDMSTQLLKQQAEKLSEIEAYLQMPVVLSLREDTQRFTASRMLGKIKAEKISSNSLDLRASQLREKMASLIDEKYGYDYHMKLVQQRRGFERKVENGELADIRKLSGILKGFQEALQKDDVFIAHLQWLDENFPASKPFSGVLPEFREYERDLRFMENSLVQRVGGVFEQWLGNIDISTDFSKITGYVDFFKEDLFAYRRVDIVQPVTGSNPSDTLSSETSPLPDHFAQRVRDVSAGMESAFSKRVQELVPAFQSHSTGILERMHGINDQIAVIAQNMRTELPITIPEGDEKFFGYLSYQVDIINRQMSFLNEKGIVSDDSLSSIVRNNEKEVNRQRSRMESQIDEIFSHWGSEAELDLYTVDNLRFIDNGYDDDIVSFNTKKKNLRETVASLKEDKSDVSKISLHDWNAMLDDGERPDSHDDQLRKTTSIDKLFAAYKQYREVGHFYRVEAWLRKQRGDNKDPYFIQNAGAYLEQSIQRQVTMLQANVSVFKKEVPHKEISKRLVNMQCYRAILTVMQRADGLFSPDERQDVETRCHENVLGFAKAVNYAFENFPMNREVFAGVDLLHQKLTQMDHELTSIYRGRNITNKGQRVIIDARSKVGVYRDNYHTLNSKYLLMQTMSEITTNVVDMRKLLLDFPGPYDGSVYLTGLNETLTVESESRLSDMQAIIPDVEKSGQQLKESRGILSSNIVRSNRLVIPDDL